MLKAESFLFGCDVVMWNMIVGVMLKAVEEQHAFLKAFFGCQACGGVFPPCLTHYLAFKVVMAKTTKGALFVVVMWSVGVGILGKSCHHAVVGFHHFSMVVVCLSNNMSS